MLFLKGQRSTASIEQNIAGLCVEQVARRDQNRVSRSVTYISTSRVLDAFRDERVFVPFIFTMARVDLMYTDFSHFHEQYV